MRARLAILLVCSLLFVLAPMSLVVIPLQGTAYAQEIGDEGEPGQEEEAEGQEGQDPNGEEAEAEVGSEGEEVAEETGPPWTYQMARMGIALLLLVAAAIALMYYRLVIVRSRAEV
ncbi:MAG: hypothetical protein ABR505_03850 [Actinomycetota bacterium]